MAATWALAEFVAELEQRTGSPSTWRLVILFLRPIGSTVWLTGCGRSSAS